MLIIPYLLQEDIAGQNPPKSPVQFLGRGSRLNYQVSNIIKQNTDEYKEITYNFFCINCFIKHHF
jgi:hypothetical protein